MPLSELLPIRIRSDRLPPRRNRHDAAERQRRLRWIVLLGAGSLAAIWSVAMTRPASAAQEAMTFGAPTVLSARGQRVKVAVPVQDAAGARASATAFLVEETRATQGYEAPLPRGFTVMRPAQSAYVVFQSDEVVQSPTVSVKFTVAGDPKSPYLMDLAIPEAEFGRSMPLAPVASAGRDAGVTGIAVRRITGPAPRTDLPPK